MKKIISRLLVFTIALGMLLPMVGIRISAATLASYNGWDISGGLATRDFSVKGRSFYTYGNFTRTYAPSGVYAGLTITARQRTWWGGYQDVDSITFRNNYNGKVIFYVSPGTHDLHFYSSNFNKWSATGTIYE